MIVITGGATGIGRAVAAHFADLGSEVMITGRRRDVLEQTASDIGAKAVVCDNSDPNDLEHLVEACRDGVDVLVNNAGGNTDTGASDPEGLTEIADAWRVNLDANVITAVLTTAALEPIFNNGACVLNIGSIAADAGAGSYGAAKAAVQSWTVDLAARLGDRGIRVNAISPGYIEDTEFFGAGLPAQRREQLQDATILKQVGIPSDIAHAVAYLASPAARHITGQNLHVNGGALTTR